MWAVDQKLKIGLVWPNGCITALVMLLGQPTASYYTCTIVSSSFHSTVTSVNRVKVMVNPPSHIASVEHMASKKIPFLAQ